MSLLRELKPIDSRYITVFPGGDDNTLTLRLLAKMNDQEHLWNYWKIKKLFNTRDLLNMVKFFYNETDDQNLLNLLSTWTSS